MTSDPQTVRWTLGQAEALAASLSRFRTERTGEPVSPSLVGTYYRAARAAADIDAFAAFVRCYPASTPARRTQSTLPQARFLSEQTARVLADVQARAEDARWSKADQRQILAQILGTTLRELKAQGRKRNG